MVRSETNSHVSEMIFQALSEESVKIAQPLTDIDIKVLEACIERLINEERLQITSDLATEPRRLIEILRNDQLEPIAENHIRKTLRRFQEVLINLSDEPEVRILN